MPKKGHPKELHPSISLYIFVHTYIYIDTHICILIYIYICSPKAWKVKLLPKELEGVPELQPRACLALRPQQRPQGVQASTGLLPQLRAYGIQGVVRQALLWERYGFGCMGWLESVGVWCASRTYAGTACALAVFVADPRKYP